MKISGEFLKNINSENSIDLMQNTSLLPCGGGDRHDEAAA